MEWVIWRYVESETIPVSVFSEGPNRLFGEFFDFAFFAANEPFELRWGVVDGCYCRELMVEQTFLFVEYRDVQNGILPADDVVRH